MEDYLETLKRSANAYYVWPRSNTIFRDDLVELIYKFKENQNPQTEAALFISIDDLILRIALQLKRKHGWIPANTTKQELYNFAYLGVRRACLKFEITGKNSLYSLPRYLSGYILNEYNKEWGRNKMNRLRAHPVFLEYWRHTSDHDYNKQRRQVRAQIREIIREAKLPYNIETQVRMWADGYSIQDIANVWLISHQGAHKNIVRAIRRMRTTAQMIELDIQGGGANVRIRTGAGTTLKMSPKETVINDFDLVTNDQLYIVDGRIFPSPFSGPVCVRDWRMAKGITEIRRCDMTQRTGNDIGMRVDIKKSDRKKR